MDVVAKLSCSDAWIKPLDFADEDFSKIWLARSRTDNGEGGGPTFICMNTRNHFPQWAGMHSDKNWHYSILEALHSLKQVRTDYAFNSEEWCTGWSDIYYIPRHLWPDYIFLSAFFGSTNSFHEMTIPTIINIIDQSRRNKPLTSIINWLGDCYGGCCNRGGSVEEYTAHRCGHSMDYVGTKVVVARHYDMLDKAAQTLGKPLKTPAWKKVPNDQRNWATFTKYLPVKTLYAYQNISQKRPENAYQKLNMPDPIPWDANGKENPRISQYSYWYGMKPPRPFNATEMEIDKERERLEMERVEEEELKANPLSDPGKPKHNEPPPKPADEVATAPLDKAPEGVVMPEAKVNSTETPPPKSEPSTDSTPLLKQVEPAPLDQAKPPLLNSVAPADNVFQSPPMNPHLSSQAEELLANMEPPL